VRVIYILIDWWNWELIFADADQSLPDHLPPSSNTETDYLPAMSISMLFLDVHFFNYCDVLRRMNWSKRHLMIFYQRRRCAFTFKNILGFLYQIWPLRRMIFYEYCFRADEPPRGPDWISVCQNTQKNTYLIYSHHETWEFSIASSIKVSLMSQTLQWSIRLASRVRTAPIRTRYIYVLQSLNIEQSWGYQGEECVRHSWQPCTLVYWTVLS